MPVPRLANVDLRQLALSPALDLAMSRQDMANYLRLAPEPVSRILARFQRDGLVRADRKHIVLLDLAGLATTASCMNPYARFGETPPAPRLSAVS